MCFSSWKMEIQKRKTRTPDYVGIHYADGEAWRGGSLRKVQTIK